MIKIENVEVNGWEAAIRGMRNPMNSWDKSDSYYDGHLFIGENDHDLMTRLAAGGSVHAKYRRMIAVSLDITAPLYWWAEFDTYKVGTVRNSCSKMHKLLSKPFEMSDFSFDKLPGYKNEVRQFKPDFDEKYKYAEKTNVYEEVARPIVDVLNELRDSYFSCNEEESKKQIWYSILQLLPESYNQKSTVLLNYEVLSAMYYWRKDHKLDEWREFCKWIESLPYSEIITGGLKGEEKSDQQKT